MGKEFGFICPNCTGKLVLDSSSRSYKCAKNHCFDIAKSGYVNLLVNTKNHSSTHGDDKAMVNARRSFLDKGYYQPLLNEICNVVFANAFSGMKILDAGCGECWYTVGVLEFLQSKGVVAEIAGVDISKDALSVGAKRSKMLSLAVGSVFRLPIADKTTDLLMTFFAPYCAQEYQRVLKKGGVMVMAIPLENHLYSLKERVYEKPYRNAVGSYELDGFELVDKREVREKILLSCNEDVQNVFTMTPYYYKTSPTDKAKLLDVASLETEIEFGVLTYKKL